MIDTIVLTLTPDMFSITKPEQFEPSAHWALNEKQSIPVGLRSKQNPTKKELALGYYKPRLTLFRSVRPLQGYKTLLRIEVSLPKLLFGNNFEELTRKDFTAVINKLTNALKSMGVATTPEQLAQADVSAIHYAKNIPLTDGSTPYHYINKIKEANIKLSLDVNQTDYRNEGHSFKWHCNSYEVVFYDKIRDLEKAKLSSKRTLDKDGFFGLCASQTKLRKWRRLEILRMEVRLNKRTKIKQLCKTLGVKTDLTFQNLFKPVVARKVLLHYLDEIESKRPALLDLKAATDKALLVALLCNNPKLGPKRIIQLYGLKRILESMNLRELRTLFCKYNKRSWYRLISDANQIELPLTPSPFRIIRDCLVKFKPLRWDMLEKITPVKQTHMKHMEVI